MSGTVDSAVRYVSYPGGHLTTLASGGNSTSKFGLQATEDLGQGLHVGFRLESTLLADTGTAGSGDQYWDRMAYLRVAGSWGELRLGRDFTPAFKSYAPADPFAFVGVGGLTNAFTASATLPILRAFGTGANTNGRSSNGLSYTTNTTESGLFANVTVAPGEGGAAGAFRYYGGRVGIVRKSFDATLYATDTRIPASGRSFQQTGLAGRYSFESAKLTFNVTRLSYLESRQNLALVGLAIPIAAGELKASYIRVSQRDAAPPRGTITGRPAADFLAIGYVHNLSKRTAIYSTVATISNAGLSTYGVSGAPAAAVRGRSSRGAEIGLRHFF